MTPVDAARADLLGELEAAVHRAGGIQCRNNQRAVSVDFHAAEHEAFGRERCEFRIVGPVDQRERDDYAARAVFAVGSLHIIELDLVFACAQCAFDFLSRKRNRTRGGVVVNAHGRGVYRPGQYQRGHECQDRREFSMNHHAPSIRICDASVH